MCGKNWLGTPSPSDLEVMCDRARDLDVAGQKDEAITIWTNAARHGSSRALYNLGVIAIDSGEEEALKYFTPAAESDPPNGDAYHALSILAWDHDLRRAAALAERAAELGVAAAAYNMGQIAQENGEPEIAFRWWSRAVELGDCEAVYNLGVYYLNQDDEESAAGMFQRSAELGYPDGMNNHAVLLRKDDEYDEAMEWYLRGADAGSVLAMNNLADIALDEGRPDEARQWWQKAADAGDASAISRLDAFTSISKGRSKTSPEWEVASLGSARRATVDRTNSKDSPTENSRYCTQCGAQAAAVSNYC